MYIKQCVYMLSLLSHNRVCKSVQYNNTVYICNTCDVSSCLHAFLICLYIFTHPKVCHSKTYKKGSVMAIKPSESSLEDHPVFGGVEEVYVMNSIRVYLCM